MDPVASFKLVELLNFFSGSWILASPLEKIDFVSVAKASWVHAVGTPGGSLLAAFDENHVEVFEIHFFNEYNEFFPWRASCPAA